MPVKKKTTTKTTATKAKKKPVAKKAVKKKTATKKKTVASAKGGSASGRKKKATSKKKTTRKKSTRIHTSEYVSPMISIPLDSIEKKIVTGGIDLNELPSLTEILEVPAPSKQKASAALPARLSFYMGIFFGAIVLHALVISVLAVMSV